MRIDSLKIRNFRCFEQAEFKFSPQFNLLVGVNGSGKSSLLNAVVSALTPTLGDLSGSDAWLDEEGNVRLALSEAKGRVRYDQCYPVELSASGEIDHQKSSWLMTLENPGGRNRLGSSVEHILPNLARRLIEGESGALPVVVFYKADRQWRLQSGAPAEAVRNHDSRIDGYASWHDAVADAKRFEDWVVAKSLERLERVAYIDEEVLLGEIDELQLVNQAVAVALPGSKGIRFDFKYRRMVLDWENRKPSAPFDLLSDGQRSLVALVADIARRMCLLNPQLGNDVLKLTPGIVLIDELDIHLHPAWQRRVVPMLKETFPKVQFFAASHSPQIIGELPAEEIIFLQDGKAAGHPEYSLGLDSSEVLEALMGSPARNTRVAEKLHAIRRAIDDDELDHAQTLLDELEAEVGAIPEVLGNRSAIRSLRLTEGDGE